MHEDYADFFCRVNGRRPFPYQERYAASPFSPTLLLIPTGLGKTDAVILPWLYSRACGNPEAPTRLILVVPRQNLTGQMAKKARGLVRAAALNPEIDVIELMAGEDNMETLRPDRAAIIIATQDLFFSRALNRGYARRPPRWPIDFALYNQDCLIVLDEIQLMDDAIATSTQLAAFRREFGGYGNAACVWMSATVNPIWLATIDSPSLPTELRLNGDDFKNDTVQKRLHASKTLARAPEGCRDPAGCALFALAQHKPGTRTLVIANTVPRAREIFAHIRAQFPSAILLHSRFRPADRCAAANALEQAIPEVGQIVVSTQVLEAGLDITSSRLITDIAPWGSLVQRFGRVNRYGHESASQIWWVDHPTCAKQKNFTAPYSPEEIARATERLAPLTSASPHDLPPEDGPAPWHHVLRRADLLDLFDTSPDLSGNELDVSRFIRATEERDAYLAWREWPADAAPSDSELKDDELCPVPIGDLREFARKHAVYAWNIAAEQWNEIDPTRLYPGKLLLTRSIEGGYTALEGWNPESKTRVPSRPMAIDGPALESDSSDPLAYQSYRQPLPEHTDRVTEAMEHLLANQQLSGEAVAALRVAAAKHDWGKAHNVFQDAMHCDVSAPDILAKQVGRARHRRRHFRHELGSALAMLGIGESDLACYLVAAHHGRIRLSIRSMPGEQEEQEARTALGIRDGDLLPKCELATGVTVAAVNLSLSVMEFGGEGGSWTERMIRLRDRLGPFRLAYLEMLLRAADTEANAKPEAAACPN